MKNARLSLRRILVISRPFWWVNTAVPFAVGALLAAKQIEPAVVVGFIYFLIPYNLLMYGVNDIFDYESDIKNPRKNGSVNGSVLPLELHGKLWWAMLLVNMPFVVYFLWIGTWASTLFLTVVLFMVFAYSQKGLRYKEKPLLDSFTSAFHYSSPFIFGILLLQGEKLWLGIFAAFFLWVAANHAFGAIQDIVPDRKAGIASIATYLGSRQTLYVVLTFYLAAATLPVFIYGPIGWFGALAILPYLALVLRCLPERNNEKSKLFASSWRMFLAVNYIIGAIGSITLLYLYNR